MDEYQAHKILEKQFAQRLGYSNRSDIPDDLIEQLCVFCDAHIDNSMASYYARSIIEKFYQSGRIAGWLRLFHALAAKLKHKRAFIGIWSFRRFTVKQMVVRDAACIAAIWSAIDDLAEGYEKSNLISEWSGHLTKECVELAYRSAQGMRNREYKARAMGGIFTRLDVATREAAFDYLCLQFIDGLAEAAYSIKSIFPALDQGQRVRAISLHLAPPHCEKTIAYLIIRNSAHIEPDEAVLLATAVRQFESEYLKNRCLLKLARHLPDVEIECLYQEFMRKFTSLPACTERLHNLYHFSAVMVDVLDTERVLNLALEKIKNIDDTQSAIYPQQKYGHLLFLLPHLQIQHASMAMEIAKSVKGNYGKSAIAKVRRHFSGGVDHCVIRGALIYH